MDYTTCTIRKAVAGDESAVAALAVRLYEGHRREELEEEFGGVILSDQAAVFIACCGNAPIGFAQFNLRHDYVEGTSSSPVGYLEGIYVEEDYRGRKVASRLLRQGEIWASEMGCTEFASDCGLDNEQSLRFHLGTGFEEANRIICFVKRL